MKRSDTDENALSLPDFIGEELGPSREAVEAGLEWLTGALPQPSAERGAARLQRAVADLPLRYAPFFDRLSELWQLPELDVRGVLARARDPKRWSRTLLRGVRSYQVPLHPGQSPERSRQSARLLHLAPGSQLPRHRHHGPETVLVLEGSYQDSGGIHVQAGQAQVMSPETEHLLHVSPDAPCVAAVLEHGIAFTGPLLRLLNPLMG